MKDGEERTEKTEEEDGLQPRAREPWRDKVRCFGRGVHLLFLIFLLATGVAWVVGRGLDRTLPESPLRVADSFSSTPS
jgi:hypothetical protein